MSNLNFMILPVKFLTRGISPAQLPKVRLEFGRRSLRFEGAKIYNSSFLELGKDNNLLVLNRGLKRYFNFILLASILLFVLYIYFYI